MSERTFDEFQARVRGLLEQTAEAKGYNATGADGPNELFEFITNTVGGPGHAVGEGIYKLVRYASKRDPVDIEKVAAWAFLIWKFHR